MATIRSVVVYEYDKQLRPGEIGVDFVDVKPDGNGDFTKRYEDPEDLSQMTQDIVDWIKNDA